MKTSRWRPVRHQVLLLLSFFVQSLPAYAGLCSWLTLALGCVRGIATAGLRYSLRVAELGGVRLTTLDYGNGDIPETEAEIEFRQVHHDGGADGGERVRGDHHPVDYDCIRTPVVQRCDLQQGVSSKRGKAEGRAVTNE